MQMRAASLCSCVITYARTETQQASHLPAYARTAGRWPASCGISCGKLPGWVHHDDIELGQPTQLAPVKRHHIGMDGYALWRHLPLAGVQVVHVPQCIILTLACIADVMLRSYVITMTWLRMHSGAPATCWGPDCPTSPRTKSQPWHLWHGACFSTACDMYEWYSKKQDVAFPGCND